MKCNTADIWLDTAKQSWSVILLCVNVECHKYQSQSLHFNQTHKEIYTMFADGNPMLSYHFRSYRFDQEFRDIFSSDDLENYVFIV